MSRNFRPLAEAQNRRQWSKQAPVAPTAIHARLEEAAHRSQIRYLEARRGRLEAAIAECSQYPAQFWNHRYFVLCTASTVASTSEAVTELKRLLTNEMRRRGHWTAYPERIPNLREALVFARWFRRHSRAVWARKAEAA